MFSKFVLHFLKSFSSVSHYCNKATNFILSTRHSAKYIAYICSFSPQNNTIKYYKMIIIPIFQMKNLRLREISKLSKVTFSE